ncbi:MAG: hypothetical protein WA885_12205 [Phormidesmis sp.]
MTQKLTSLIEQAETLSPKDQLALIAHLAQTIKVTDEQIALLPQPENDETESSALPDSGKSIRQIMARFAAHLPEDVLAQLPRDGAEQHDHYIYGTPKIQE